MLWLIIVAIIIFSFIIACIFLTGRKKINLINIKITEAKAQISLLLNKKNELLIDVKNEFDSDSNILDGIDKLKDYIDDDFEYNDKLRHYYKLFYKFIHSDDYFEKFSDNEKLTKDILLIKEEEEALSGCIRYYNDQVDEYNCMLSDIHIKIVTFFCKSKPLKLFNNDKIEFLDILKKENE